MPIRVSVPLASSESRIQPQARTYEEPAGTSRRHPNQSRETRPTDSTSVCSHDAQRRNRIRWSSKTYPPTTASNGSSKEPTNGSITSNRTFASNPPERVLVRAIAAPTDRLRRPRRGPDHDPTERPVARTQTHIENPHPRHHPGIEEEPAVMRIDQPGLRLQALQLVSGMTQYITGRPDRPVTAYLPLALPPVKPIRRGGPYWRRPASLA